MDNGKAKIYLKDGIPVVTIYHNGEIERSDIVWIHQQVLKLPLELPVDIIIDRAGSYSLSPGACTALVDLMDDHNRVGFVIHNSSQEIVCDLAAKTYLGGHDVGKFYSLAEASSWMLEDGANMSVAHS